MKTENQTTGLKHRIWESAVGIELEAKAKKDGTYFWHYRFARAYTTNDEWKYTDTFSSHNDEALQTAIVKMIRFRESNDATEWAKSRIEIVNAQQAV